MKLDRTMKNISKLGKKFGKNISKRMAKGDFNVFAAVGLGLTALAGTIWLFARKGADKAQDIVADVAEKVAPRAAKKKPAQRTARARNNTTAHSRKRATAAA